VVTAVGILPAGMLLLAGLLCLQFCALAHGLHVALVVLLRKLFTHALRIGLGHFRLAAGKNQPCSKRD
jgi:hypothetical protein